MGSLCKDNVWRQLTIARDWDDALCRLPAPHVLQSWEWGEFKCRWGWQAERWLLTSTDARPRAAVQLLRRTVGRWPVCVLYAPKGPVAQDLESYADALALIERRAREGRAIWAKIDGDRFGLAPQPGGDSRDGDLKSLRELLTARHWRTSPTQVQFRNTGISALTGDEALLEAMKPKTRYNIRLAQKRGVTIRTVLPIEADDARRLYAMYVETSKRDGFLIRDAAYYLDAWRAMNATGFIAEKDGDMLAGIVLFTFASRAWYFYGMSRDVGREHMPNHLLQWTAMCWAYQHGCTVYDWWGSPEHEADEGDSMAGVWRFKAGFGAQFLEGTGAWDYAPVPFVYRAYLKVGARFVRSGLAG